MKPFIPWIGGKRSLIKEILSRIPRGHRIYIEVFGGAAAVLLGKTPSPIEIYNDYNSDLVNLFLVLKDKPISFLNELGQFPLNSREEFQHLRKLLTGAAVHYEHIEEEIALAEEIMTEEQFKEIEAILKTKAELFDVNRAVAFYRIQKLSYGATGKSYAGTPISMSVGKIRLEIMRAKQRLQRVVIENQSFEKLIPKHADNPDAFYYCDPPYYNTEKYYDADFPQEYHWTLKEELTKIKGKFLLSYNDCDFIRDLYKDFYIVPVTRTNNLKQRDEPGSVYKELLIANYDITKLSHQRPRQLSIWER